MTVDHPDEPCEPAGTTTDYRYAPIPEAVLYDERLDGTAIRVYGCLMRHGLTPGACYPSHARIASLIHCAKRSVARPLEVLEATGWVSRVPRYDGDGRRTSNGYRVHSERTHPAQERGTPHVEERGGTHAQTATEREPLERESVEREEVPTRPGALDLLPACVAPAVPPAAADFDIFWERYPRRNGKRIGKQDAARAWLRMPPISRTEALTAVEHYAAACNAPDGPLAMDAHRWLAKLRWKDWLTPAEPNRPRQSAFSRSAFLNRPGRLPLAEAVAISLGQTTRSGARGAGTVTEAGKLRGHG